MTRNRDSGAIKYLAACLMIAALLCVAQIRGSSILILGVLMLQLLLALAAAFQGMANPVLMFFLPWSTLMKLAPGSISFYTLSLIVICLAYVIRFRARLNMPCVVAAIFVMGLTLPAKLLAGGGLSMDYIMFLFLLALFPTVMRECVSGVSHRLLTVFFSLGIITAALSARSLASYGSIARYIDVDSWTNVVRYSGYYGDANFYSAQISAALSGVLLQMLEEKNWKKILPWILLAVLLIYCGLMSASKMFVITLVVMGLLWILAILTMPERGGVKLMLLLAICAGTVIVIGSGIFTDAIATILYRFSFSSDISALTTGRTDLWLSYAKEIFSSPRILLLGNGYTNLKVNGRASHNSLIQLIFQFGLIGSVPLIRWMRSYVSDALAKCRPKILHALIVLVGIFLPWMALDMLFFDEFFLMPLFAVSCILSLPDRTEQTGQVPDHQERLR